MRCMLSPHRLALATLVALLACDGPTDNATQVPQPSAATVPAAPSVDAERLRAHVQFLASDAQEGRAPGSDADQRVQQYVEDAFKAAGLDPAFVDGYIQPFDVTDGVRPRQGAAVTFRVKGAAVPHAVVPFTTDGAVEATAIYVGHGIATAGKGTGDYKDLADRVEGKIVIALDGGPDDPHVAPASLRPQSKLIAARDHGAAGFVLWDPTGEGGYPNHGRADDLGLPAVFVGTGGNTALLAALRAKTLEGLRPGTHTRKHKLSVATPVERVKIATANVAGRLVGSGASDKILVLGAHMDHLGWGTSSSLSPGDRSIHNGADDNASGVAVVLELARELAARPVASRPHDILFMAFGAEEMGLLGSKYFVASLDPAVRARMIAMLNFDMVGRLAPEGLMVSGLGTAPQWPDLVEELRGDLKVRTTNDGYGPSDHGSFYEAKIPVLHFFTGPHEDYHRPSDDIDKIDFDGAARIASYAGRLAGRMLDEAMVPTYVEVARPTRRGGGFRVSLGTIPDYAAEVDGVALSGVRKGGAAEKAGLKKGDVITKLGEREIHNLDDYMASFATMHPGKVYPVIVQRDGKPVELEVTPDKPKNR
jgi:aminopeptidase YwaD